MDDFQSEPEPLMVPLNDKVVAAAMSKVFEPVRLVAPAKVFTPLALEIRPVLIDIVLLKTFVPVAERLNVLPEATEIVEAGLPIVVVP